MAPMLLEYSLPKETITAIMMSYKNIKILVRSSELDTNFFDIVAEVLQGDTLVPYMVIICLRKENGFTLKSKNKLYPEKSITDTYYADDIELLVNTPDPAEFQLEQEAGGIGLYVNANKSEFMC